MQTYLKTYIRDTERKPIGVVVLVKEGGSAHMGYSLCNPKDKFNKKLGTTIALSRATHPCLEDGEALAPIVFNRRDLVLDYYNRLENRAQKYFKNENIPTN